MNQIYACREGKETPSTDAKITSTATTPTRSVSRSIVSKLLLGVFLFLVFGASKSMAQGTRTFVMGAAGPQALGARTFPFVVPPGVTQITFDVTGGGGGGAGSDVANGFTGGGGGGGAFRQYTNVAVTPGSTITIVLGDGGAAGAAGLPGGNGSGTTVSVGGISVTGGSFGALTGAGNGGSGAGLTSGGNGGPGYICGACGGLGPFGAGGGGAATLGTPGGPGGNGTSSAGPNPAAGLPFGGTGSGGVGTPASGAGGGGGGAGFVPANPNLAGGAGWSGKVVLTYTCPTYTLPAFGPFCAGAAALPITGDGVAAGGTFALAGLSPLFVVNVGPTLTGTNVTGSLATGFSFNPATAGNITVTYAYTDPNPLVGPACVTTIARDVVVFPQSVTLSALTNTCAAGLVAGPVTAVAGFTQQFSFDNGTTWQASNVGPVTPGCYTVTSRYIKNGAFGNVADLATSPCANSASVIGVVFPASVVLNVPTATCQGTGLTVTPVTVVAGFTQQFSFDNGTTWQVSNVGPTTPQATTGCYVITSRYIKDAVACGGTLAGATGPCTNSTSVSGVVFPTSVTLNVPTATCQGTGLTVTPVTGVTGFTQQFSFDNGTTWQASNVGPTTPQATTGCYVITSRYIKNGACGNVNNGDAGPCANSTSVSGVVFPTSVVITTPAGPAGNTCNTTLTGTPVAAVTGFTQQWSFDNGTTWGASNVSPATPGCYTISSRYIKNGACGGTSNGAPSPCANSTSVQAVIYPPQVMAPITPVCSPTPFTPTMVAGNVAGFIAQFSNDGGTTWYTGNSPFSNAGCYLVTGRYILQNACGGTFANAAGPCANATPVDFIIYPQAPVISSPATTCAPTQFVLPNVPSQAPLFTTQWSIVPTGNAPIWQFLPTIPSTPGVYDVQARYVNSAVCGSIPAFTGMASVFCNRTNIVTATINSTPVVTQVVSPAALCCNSNLPAINLSLTNAPMLPVGGVLVYNWTNSNASIGLPVSGQANIGNGFNIPAFTSLCNPTTQIGTITVTASYTNAGATCTSAPMIFSITVNANVTGTINGPNQTICAGQTADINMVLTGVPNLNGNFKITRTSDNVVTTANHAFTVTANGAVATTLPANVLPNTTSNPITYRVEWMTTTSLVDANGCFPTVGSPLTGFMDVTVNPLPILTATTATVGPVCPGSTITYNVQPAAGNTVPATFSWWVNGVLQAANVAYGNVSYVTPACPTNVVLTFTFTPFASAAPNCQGPTVTPATITSQDITKPTMAAITNYTLTTDGAGDATYTRAIGNVCLSGAPTQTSVPSNAAILAAASDNCTSNANLVVAFVAAGSGVTGTNCAWTATYNYTITDICGNVRLAKVVTTGGDTEAPQWTTVAGSLNRTVEYCDQNGVNGLLAAQTLAPVATDNCVGAITYIDVDGVFAQSLLCPTAGTITNTFTARDACNNVSSIFTQVITIVDTRGPTITGAIAQTLNTGSSVGCTAILPNYILGTGGIAPNAALPGITATDCSPVLGLFPAPAAITYNANASGANRIWQSPAPGITVGGFGGLVIPVTIFAQDACGNISSVTFNVTALDQTKPIVRCHPITVTLDAAGSATITPSLLDGNGSPFPAGLGTATLPYAFSKDSCSAVNLTFTFINLPNATSVSRTFSCSDVALNSQSSIINVQIQGTDASGNFDVCTAPVTVRENTPPVFTVCPATNTITLNKDAGCAVTLPDFRTAPWAGTFVATDICSPSVGPITYSQSPAPGSIFLGNITFVDVTMTATDAHTNTATCTTRVILRDVTPPTFVGCPASTPVKPAPGHITAAPGFCSTTFGWTVPTLLDNCTVLGAATLTSITATGTTTLPDLSAAIYRTQGSAVTATFFVGTTTITYIATDAAGNTATCSFTVTVYDDIAPAITCPGVSASPSIVASVVSVNANPGVCSWTKVGTDWNATATDNCLLSSVTYNLTRTGFPLVSIGSGTSLANVVFTGVTVVTWRAVDFSGNASTCSFTVTVVDNQAPTLTCPANVIATVNAPGCSALVPAIQTNATFSDNCAVTLVEWDVFGATPVASGIGNIGAYTFASGISTVQYRVRDAAGNIVVCTFTVTVGSGVTGTVNFPNGTQQVGLNTNPQPTVIFTGAGSASAPGTQQYTFRYNLSVNGGPVGADQFIATAVGSNVVSLVQPNNVVSTFRYTLLGVTDGQLCAGTVAAAPNNSTTIAVVIGTPSLTLSPDMAPNQINPGGAIEEAIVVRNIGTVATSGVVTVNASVYSTLTGLTVAQSAAAATINGTPYTPTAGWTFNALTGDFTSANPIPAGGNSIIRIRITRGSGLLAGSAGQVNHTITVSGGNEPAAQANDGTNTINLQITKN